jgi:hypothetical protein
MCHDISQKILRKKNLDSIVPVTVASPLKQCCGSGSGAFFTPGSGIWDGEKFDPDKHPGSATLL